MLSTKMKRGSGSSTNDVIKCTKNPRGGGGQTESKEGAKAPPGLP